MLSCTTCLLFSWATSERNFNVEYFYGVLKFNILLPRDLARKWLSKSAMKLNSCTQSLSMQDNMLQHYIEQDGIQTKCISSKPKSKPSQFNIAHDKQLHYNIKKDLMRTRWKLTDQTKHLARSLNSSFRSSSVIHKSTLCQMLYKLTPSKASWSCKYLQKWDSTSIKVDLSQF